jgi:hypothetical protein
MLRCEKGKKFKDLQLRVFSEVQGCCIRTCRQCIEENWRSLLDKNYKLINEKKLKHFIESIQPLLESLKPLEKGSGIKIEEKHIVQMIKYFLKMTMIH